MSGTNRNRKVWLSEAWMHYWSVLYPDGVDWQADLDSEIRNRLYFPGEAISFPSGRNPGQQPPSWAVDLEIGFRENLVSASFRKTDFGTFPLFANSPFKVGANWKDKNPFDGVGDQTAVKGRDLEGCLDFLFAAVRDCGSRIQNHLLSTLRETKPSKFEIYGRPGGEDLGDESSIPGFALSEISLIDIPQNALADRLGVPKYHHVQIKQRKPSKSKAGPHGSLHEQDAALVEEMKQLIDRGEVPSVLQAATKVEPKAGRRKPTSVESVIRRLQRRFSEQYPDYSNRRGQKGAPSP